MKLSELPWGLIAKMGGAALVASGLFGGGYLTANKAPETQADKKVECESTKIIIPLKVYINGKEVKPVKE